MKKSAFIFFISLTSLALINFFITGVFADDMSSQNFQIKGGNFNMTSGNKASTNYKLSDVVGQVAATVFGSKGYIIRSGFLNGAAAETFSFAVVPNVVDFGTLVKNTPVEKIVNLKITNGNVPGYIVKVAENQPLSTSVGAEIDDTLCDKSKATCSPTAAATWTLNTSYGFGYHINSRTSPSDFAKDTFFRSFPATRRNETPVTIMQSGAKKVTDLAVMTLKVNIGPNQPVGQYRNVISFTAVAGI